MTTESASVPKSTDLMDPTLDAIRALGGSASIEEIANRVIEDMNLPPQVVQVPRNDGRQTRLKYNLAWSRTYLKRMGLLDNSDRGVWSLTALGSRTSRVDPAEVSKEFRASNVKSAGAGIGEPGDDPLIKDPQVEDDSWRVGLSDALLKMSPEAFERLCQRLLRESGFIEVEVTGRSGDGGIDGRGVIRLAGLISFPVVFQCKRYKNSVDPRTVRDFRGAMVGRADRGLILTTGYFTRDAHAEATRDGAPPIDLIDGSLLMDRLKELGLGVRTKTVEVVEVDTEWFYTI